MKKILIIGAGFSGVMTAVHLLRSSPSEKIEILLLNRSGRMARGLAYGTQSSDHTLNVPCGNMSAFPDDPSNFLKFAQSIDPAVSAGSFISRKIYGDYLENLLTTSEKSSVKNLKLNRVIGEAKRLEFDVDGGYVWLSDDRCYKWNKLVLAFGHFPSSNPDVLDRTFYNSSRYIRDPWNMEDFSKIPATSPVLLLGTGLTAVDASISLLRRNSNRSITAVSRRGLLPQPHRHTTHKPATSYALEKLLGHENTVSSQLKFFLKEINALKNSGGDWRDAFAALRPHTTAIWEKMGEKQRRQFIRHLQPYWDSHRHRVAAIIHDRFEVAKTNGIVKTFAGRIKSFEEMQNHVKVHIQPRGSLEMLNIQAEYVINCTGPASNLERVDNELVRQLISENRITPDKLGLGLHLAPNGAVIGGGGKISSSLYYVGPLLKADKWEATAVPELRIYARDLAMVLLTS